MPWNPAVWISQNWLYITGWFGLLLILYRAYTIVNKFAAYGTAITTLQTDMEAVKTNHLPHLEEAVVNVNNNITGLRDDVKDGFSRLSDSLNVVLTRIG